MKINDIIQSLISIYPKYYSVKHEQNGRKITFTTKNRSSFKCTPLILILARDAIDFELCNEKNLEAIFTIVGPDDSMYMHRNLSDAFDRLKHGRNLFETKENIQREEELQFRLKIKNDVSGCYRTICRSANIEDLRKRRDFLITLGQDAAHILISKHTSHIIHKKLAYHEYESINNRKQVTL
jgi:hypothetical protein